MLLKYRRFSCGNRWWVSRKVATFIGQEGWCFFGQNMYLSRNGWSLKAPSIMNSRTFEAGPIFHTCTVIAESTAGEHCWCHQQLLVSTRPVTRWGANGVKPPLKNDSPLLEKCVGHSLKLLDIVQKI